MSHHIEEIPEDLVLNEETPENIQEFLREDQSEELIKWGIEDFYFLYIDPNASSFDVWPYVKELYNTDILTHIVNITNLDSITSVESTWKYVFITYVNESWKEKTISIDIVSALLWHDEYVWELNPNTAERIHFQEIQKYLHNVEEISQGFDAIDRILERNLHEVWEEIGKEDIAKEWPFEWKDIIQIFSEISEIFSDTRFLRSSIFITDDSLWEIHIDFQALQGKYAEYLLGLWENNEELTSVIPKTQEEVDLLLNSIVHSKTPTQLIEYMKNIHSKINENNWQDGSVEKNYAYFTDMMNELIFTKMKAEVLNNQDSEVYLDLNILLEFASLTSWRTNGFESNLSGSDMDSRLWRPDISRRILVEAMKISWWVLDQVSDNIDMQDDVLWGKSPWAIVQETITKIEKYVTSTDENWQSISFNGRDILISLWFQSAIENAECCANYNTLDFDSMITISSLARVIEALKPKDEYTTVNGIHDDDGGKRVEKWIMWKNSHIYMKRDNKYDYEYALSLWMPWQTVYRERNKEKKNNFDQFKEIVMWSTKDSIEHVWSELNRNFDDTINEKALSLIGWVTNEQSRAIQAWLTPWTVEANIFSLYNDIEGNGWLFEISDWTRDGLKTGGYLIANVAWAIIVWWILLATLPVAWAVVGWVWWAMIWTAAIQNLLVQWTIYWLSASAVWYSLDAAVGDARWFWTRQEALIWLSSDFVLGWLTGFWWWLLAARYGAKSMWFLSRWDITNKSIFAWDLLFLWIWPEILRIKQIQEMYHSSKIFSEQESE